MYKEFYGFQEKPFHIVPDPGFLYLTAKHRTALTYLEYGLTNRIGFVVLTGEIGTGKTTLIKQLLKQISTDVEVAVVFNTNVSSKQLLELILYEFEIEVPAHGKAGCLDILNQFLIEKYALGKRTLLIVDEAHNLSMEALEEIRMLSNLQSYKDPLIQILLVGQPGLRTKLQHPLLAQLSQRIAVSYHLAPLSMKETKAYIAHRLRVAGCDNDKLFALQAVEQLFYHSGGIPRIINLLCDAALVYGYVDHLTTIDKSIIEHVVTDKQEFSLSAPSSIGDQIELPNDGYQGNGRLLKRLESLEKRVNHLTALAKKQIEKHERRAEGYKDMLVHRLERMLSQERKRADKLLVYCNLLRKKLNLTTINSEKKKA